MTRFSNALHLLVGIFGPFAVQSLHVAQCAQPDSLDGGPCCASATESAPLHDFTQDSLQICWLDCGIEQVIACRAEWNLEPPEAPRHRPTLPPGGCEPRPAGFRLLDPSGGVQWEGNLLVQYSRTWLETDLTGADHQVWRFLVNGDLSPGASAGPPPCPLPPCIATMQRARFTGYIDMARACANGSFQFAWMLSHLCDSIDHHAGFPRAGVFHPERSYTFVGPAAGFVPGPLQPLEASGGSPFEAVRKLSWPSYMPGSGPPPLRKIQVSCRSEEQSFHSLLPVRQSCPCTSSSGELQFTEGSLALTGACGTSIATPGGNRLPGFLSMGIGAWTDATQYPGEEVLRWNAGDYSRVDPCLGGGNDIYFGVTTTGGWSGTQILSGGLGSPLPDTYVDQASTKRYQCFGLFVCTPVPIMNVPYFSDFIINLNH